MEYPPDFYIAVGLAIGAIGATWALTKQLSESATIAMRAHYSLRMIAQGDDPKKYHNIIQDAKIDGLAGVLIGGRKRLFRDFHKRKRVLADER